MNPTKYTRAIADEICQRLAGGESLASICKDEAMPTRPAVHCWVRQDVDGFATQYRQARKRGLNALLATCWKLQLPAQGAVERSNV